MRSYVGGLLVQSGTRNILEPPVPTIDPAVFVHPTPQFHLDFLEPRSHSIPTCLPLEVEGSGSTATADEGKVRAPVHAGRDSGIMPDTIPVR